MYILMHDKWLFTDSMSLFKATDILDRFDGAVQISMKNSYKSLLNR